MTNPAALSDAKRELLEKMLRGAGERAAPVAPVRPRPPGAVVPLTADQRQVWLHATMAPDVPLYNESITIHRFGSFDLAAMEASLNEILRRHESWRTCFAEIDGELVQCVREDVRIALPVDDISHLPADQQDAAAIAIGSEDARRPVDLGEAPLLRARIVRLAEDNHRLYLTLHHIIFDGVSIYRVIVPELAALYAAFAKGEASPLPEPVLQYGDYAVWQQDHLNSPPIQKQIDYWRGALADAPPKLELAGDRARPVHPTHAGSMEVFEIPDALVEALKAVSLAEGATLYMTLLAAYKAMLHRYSGEEDILVGGVTDLRRRPELERVVGYFLNTIALRSRPAGEMPFRDHLAQVRDSTLGALGASEVPFDEVVRALGIRRQPGAHPLFNHLFSIEPPVDPFPQGWDLTQMDVVVGGAKFDLYLELDERPDGMMGRFLYSTELFDPSTIRRMIGHWLSILEKVAVDPGCRLCDLPLMTDAEQAGFRAVLTGPARELPAAMLPDLIREQVRARPDAIAIRCGARRWSYAELDAQADRLAGTLHAAGLGRGDLVALCVERSPEMVAALLAIMRVGAAYLPLDPDFPQRRLDDIVGGAGAAALLTQPHLAATLPDWGLKRIMIDEAADAAAPPAPVTVGPVDLAYVLYTSGSTGKPKGVEIDHGALVNLLASMREAPGFTADDSLLAVTTLSFDIAGLELFLPLMTGGELIVAPRDVAVDPARLAELIAERRPSVMQATPATWRALIATGWRGDRALKLLCGGEAMPRELADQLLDRAGSVWNVYGPTETTIWSTVHRVTREEGPVPIGRPIDNTTTYVLDGHGNLVPPGLIGELHIGGAGLARGYRNRPDLTGERFVECAAAPGERLYRTGDLARYRADGLLQCLGRIDNDQKIRGFRVAVEEIEGALAEHEGIAAAAVRSWEDASGERSLAAYFVSGGGAVPTPSELRAHLAQSLPDYMIPSRFQSLEALPMTPNGKVDRKALPEPDAAAIGKDFEPPVGPTEEKLAQLWCELLEVEAVGRGDSFFELGGHSLLVARLLHRIEAEWGRRIGMAAFFRGHRLCELAAQIEARDEVGDPGELVPVQPLGDRPPLLWLDSGPAMLELARLIGDDQPFLGVPLDPILERELRPEARFEDIAGQVAAAILTARPHGPYYIGGWCTAGILAFEVARQIRAMGEDVPLLLLGHSINPVSFLSVTGMQMKLSKARFHAGVWLRLPLAERLSYALARARGVLEETGMVATDREPDRYTELRTGLENAAYGYRPGRYDGNVTLFQPKERLDVLDTRPGWAEVVDGVLESYDMPGSHGTMWEHPNIEAFAAQLRASLLRAQEGQDADRQDKARKRAAR